MSSSNASRPKYVFITGGVASSLGKGIISSSLAILLKRGEQFRSRIIALKNEGFKTEPAFAMLQDTEFCLLAC